MLGLTKESADKIMILATILVVMAELLITFLNNFSGRTARIRRYLADGGIGRAELVKHENGKALYRHKYQEQEYEFEMERADAPQFLDIFFDVRDPSKVETEEFSRGKRILKIAGPVLPVLVLLLIYKLLY